MIYFCQLDMCKSIFRNHVSQTHLFNEQFHRFDFSVCHGINQHCLVGLVLLRTHFLRLDFTSLLLLFF